MPSESRDLALKNIREEGGAEMPDNASVNSALERVAEDTKLITQATVLPFADPLDEQIRHFVKPELIKAMPTYEEIFRFINLAIGHLERFDFDLGVKLSETLTVEARQINYRGVNPRLDRKVDEFIDELFTDNRITNEMAAEILAAPQEKQMLIKVLKIKIREYIEDFYQLASFQSSNVITVSTVIFNRFFSCLYQLKALSQEDESQLVLRSDESIPQDFFQGTFLGGFKIIQSHKDVVNFDLLQTQKDVFDLLLRCKSKEDEAVARKVLYF